MSDVQLLVGTPKGAFILDGDADRRDWALRGPLCEGWPIHDLIIEPGTGAILAAGGSPWYGPAVWRSEDDGRTWTHSSDGLTYGDGEAIDQAYPSATVTTDTCQSSPTTKVHISDASSAHTVGATATAVAAGDLLICRVHRKVSTDNMAGDARLIAVRLEFTGSYSD